MRYLFCLYYLFVMNADHTTLRKIAHLSRLELKESDESKILDDLNRILTWVEKLNEVDTTGIEPLTHMTAEINVMRPDVVSETLKLADALKNAPKHDGAHFCVPKVIE